MYSITSDRPFSTGSLFLIDQKFADNRFWRDQLPTFDCLAGPDLIFLQNVLKCALTCDAERHGTNCNFGDDPRIHVFAAELSEFLQKINEPGSISVIKKRAASLESKGVLVKSRYSRPGAKRPSNLYVLAEPHVLMGLPADKPSDFVDHKQHKGTLQQIQNTISEQGGQLLLKDEVDVAQHEALWNNLCCALMRTSAHDKKHTNSFETVYSFKGAKISVVTSSTKEISHIDDQQFLRGLITYVCHSIDERREAGQEIKNEFWLDIRRLLKIMNLDTGGGNRARVRGALERLYNTNYEFKLSELSRRDLENFLGFFGLIDELENRAPDTINLKFLVELDSQTDYDFVDGRRIRYPRYYRFVLRTSTFNNLIRKDKDVKYFIDNPEVLQLSEGLLHVLYSWCCYSVSRKKTGAPAHKVRPELSMKDLGMRIAPRLSPEVFTRRLTKILKKRSETVSQVPWIDGEINEVPLCGYVVVVTPAAGRGKSPIIGAYWDAEDPVIGSSSAHNRRLSTAV
ncbi:hypothetical protein A3709_20670 [Halioglobus sp. HI00S01]|uniref:replication initiator protein A n=1 Tax=Halioglobus sp. HI00S01 TaxID=1822214 RepID=UPI0007C30F33|nr:replication initiator protein A [Halioglobus sp. HI00S01]KZX58028.1 hypothetical protein A3709_20670 [Halioglobus sp. HI00S01]